MLRIHELPSDLRPRERLRTAGAEALSDIELLAILLGSGTRRDDLLSLSARTLKGIDLNWPRVECVELQRTAGLGHAKACTVLAALEFARRRIRPRGARIAQPQDVLPLVRHLADRPQEHFVALSLNGAHEVISVRIITIGLLNSSLVHPREVFSPAISDRACALVVAHNHPSGNTTPSSEDARVTEALANAGQILGIPLLDHVIFGGERYYSFKEQGRM